MLPLTGGTNRRDRDLETRWVKGESLKVTAPVGGAISFNEENQFLSVVEKGFYLRNIKKMALHSVLENDKSRV